MNPYTNNIREICEEIFPGQLQYDMMGKYHIVKFKTNENVVFCLSPTEHGLLEGLTKIRNLIKDQNEIPIPESIFVDNGFYKRDNKIYQVNGMSEDKTNNVRIVRYKDIEGLNYVREAKDFSVKYSKMNKSEITSDILIQFMFI